MDVLKAEAGDSHVFNRAFPLPAFIVFYALADCLYRVMPLMISCKMTPNSESHDQAWVSGNTKEKGDKEQTEAGNKTRTHAALADWAEESRLMLHRQTGNLFWELSGLTYHKY